MTQVIARVPDDLAAALDRLVSSGAFASRSDAVREALVQLVDRHRRAEIGSEIVEGYRRMPQTDDEVGWVDAIARAMIEEEPW
jgi:Arc/MetJ-type ribon-helix-helix transcriptional regulator